MFNVYYINYAKAFEIAMQMDNKVLEQTIKDLILRSLKTADNPYKYCL